LSCSTDNYPEPRERLRKGNFPYIFKLDKDYVCETETGWGPDKAFDSKWLHISEEGVITVKAGDTGYAWDGCTPKWSFLNLVIIGAPDGHIDYRTMKPFTYYASLVHDALYQYLDSVPVKKSEIDRLFFVMLGDFKLRWPYYILVRLFSGFAVKQNNV